MRTVCTPPGSSVNKIHETGDYVLFWGTFFCRCDLGVGGASPVVTAAPVLRPVTGAGHLHRCGGLFPVVGPVSGEGGLHRSGDSTLHFCANAPKSLRGFLTGDFFKELCNFSIEDLCSNWFPGHHR